jgi:hypothetical protein
MSRLETVARYHEEQARSFRDAATKCDPQTTLAKNFGEAATVHEGFAADVRAAMPPTPPRKPLRLRVVKGGVL